MSEMTVKFKEKLNERYKQLNQNVEKISKAGKGLVAKIVDVSSCQFNELVSTGEKTDTDILSQVTETVKQPFTDIRGSMNKAKFASVGLMVKVRENGNKYIEELINEGQKTESSTSTKSEKKDNNSQSNSKSKNKNSSKAAA